MLNITLYLKSYFSIGSYFKTPVVKIILLLSFTSLVCLSAAIEAKGQSINEILKRMERHGESLVSLKATVTLSKHDVLLDENDVKFGNLHYLPRKNRNIYLRIDWIEPVRQSFLIANGKYLLYTPRLKQAIRGKVSEAHKNKGSGDALAFMSMSKSQLKINYQIKFLGVEKVSDKEVWRLRLDPKKKSSYKFAELWVDGNGMPIQSKIFEKNNDSTTIKLSNLNKNMTIRGDIFRINLPKGVKIIDG